MNNSFRYTARQASSGMAKGDEIAELLGNLKANLQHQRLSSAAKLHLLSRLKSRIVSAEAAAVFTQDDVKSLCVYAFENSDPNTEPSLVALKCLANLLLLKPTARQFFVDEGYAGATAGRLEHSADNELLCSRILFLLTYDTIFDFDDLFENYSLANSIHQNITSHASLYVGHNRERHQHDKSKETKPMPTLAPGALTESLKLLFNLNQLYPHHIAGFTRTIEPILQILTHMQLEVKALQPPVTQLINALLSLDLPGPVSPDSCGPQGYTTLFPEQSLHDNHLRLINILESGVRSSEEEELDGLVPLVTLLRRVYELAPPSIKSEMRIRLLPSNEERAEPLGKSNSLPSRLLRLSTAPTAPRLREGISSFLFEMSDKDAATFVRNVGYGYAAGYLMTHSLPVPENASGDPGGKVTTVDGQDINPVTGQRRDMEPEDPLPEMTDEEKEREAEKLFVLFERLKATGVMNVVNPVQQAVQEGRFEEVD